MKTRQERWHHWRSQQWIVVNTISFAIATVVALAASESSPERTLPLVVPFMGLLVNSIVGSAQDVIIHRDLGQPYWGQWLLATSLGGGLGWLAAAFGGGMLMSGFNNLHLWDRLPPYLPAGLMFLWLGLVMGAGIGLAQLWLLRKRIARPGQWLRVSMVGRGLGWVVAVAIAASFSHLNWLDVEFSQNGPVALVITGILVGSVIGLVYGWFTARVLQQLWQATPLKAASKGELA